MNNKKRTDSYIPAAIKALEVSGIAKDGKVDSSYRGQISSFGAASTIGSFKQAVAFFAQDAKSGDSKIARSDLIVAIDYILRLENCEGKTVEEKESSEEILQVKEKIKADKKEWVNSIKTNILGMTDSQQLKTLESRYLDAAVALKVAMGVYDMGKNDKKED